MSAFLDTRVPAETWMSCREEHRNCSCPNHLKIPVADIVLPGASDPGLHHLTTTNNVPTCAEETHIRETITSLQAQQLSLSEYSQKLEVLLADSFEQVGCIEMELHKIQSAHNVVDKAVKAHEAISSPIRRLPTELLAIIFEYAVDFPVPVESCQCLGAAPFCPHNRNILWSLELVCKRWRDLVINSTHLWSFIGVDLFVAKQSGYIRLLAKQLVRVGLTTAISVSIVSTRPCTDGVLPMGIAAILLPLVPRIQELDLVISPNSEAALALWSNSFHSLKRLYISKVYHSSRNDSGHCYAFANAPKLVDLETNYYGFGTQEPYVLPWDQLVRYRSGLNREEDVLCSESFCAVCPSPCTALRMLAKTTSKLQECRICFQAASHPVEIRMQPPVVSGIQSLTICARPRHEGALAVEQFMNTIQFPNLTDLTVDFTSEGLRRWSEDSVFTEICAALERAGGGTLSRFCFKHGVVPSDGLVRLFNVAPGLCDLRLEDVEGEFMDPTIELLTVRDGERVLASELRTLHVSGDLQFDVGVFAAMVESRRSMARLWDVDLCWHIEGGGEEMEAQRSVLVERLKPLGLNLTTRLKMI